MIPNTMEEFQDSKLKKFMGMVKSLMQDTIYDLTRKSYFQFVDYIKCKVPRTVISLFNFKIKMDKI